MIFSAHGVAKSVGMSEPPAAARHRRHLSMVIKVQTR